MIEDLQAEFPEIARLQVRRPRVSSERIAWAFLSALGAGFIASGITGVAMDVLWPWLLPPTQPHPPWLTQFLISRAVQLVAMAAVGLRAGGIATLFLCAGYEAGQVIVQVPGRMAICERIGPQPDSSFDIQCEPVSIALATWPIWLGLAVGALGSRRLLPPSTAGANTLLRAAGAFALIITASGIAFGLVQMTLLSGLAGRPSDPPRPGEVSYQVAVSTAFLIVEFVAGAVAGALLRRAPTAAVLLLALLVVRGIDFGIRLIRSNVDSGVPHPPELAYLQSFSVLVPAAGVLGIAVGRLLARRNRVVAPM